MQKQRERDHFINVINLETGQGQGAGQAGAGDFKTKRKRDLFYVSN